MIQTILGDKYCEMHKKKIISLCLNPICNQNRLACHNCFTDSMHSGHLKFLKEYQYEQEIFDQPRVECNSLISQLDKMSDAILNMLNRLKKGISDKYNQPIERLNQLTNVQFNQYIINIAKIDISGKEILQSLKNTYSNFINQLNSQMIELQLLQHILISVKKRLKWHRNYMKKDMLYWDKKDYNQAIKVLDQALAYNPNHLMSLWCKGCQLTKIIGYSLVMMGKQLDSIEWFDKVLAIDNKYFLSFDGKGSTLRLMKKYQESIELYDKSLLINPKQISSLFGKGDSLRLIGKHQESIEQNGMINHQIQIKNTCIHVMEKAMPQSQIIFRRMMGKNLESFVWQDKALAMNPKHTDSLYSKGAALNQLKEYSQSLEYFDQALATVGKYYYHHAINPNHFQALGSKGGCLNSMERYQEAFEYLSKAIQVNSIDKYSINQMSKFLLENRNMQRETQKMNGLVIFQVLFSKQIQWHFLQAQCGFRINISYHQVSASQNRLTDIDNKAAQFFLMFALDIDIQLILSKQTTKYNQF